MKSNSKPKKGINKYLNNFLRTSLLVLSTFLFISPVIMLKDYLLRFMATFSKNVVLSSLVGTTAGSLMLGNPTSSYVIASELLKLGTDVVLVSAFLISWVTVGIAQIPVESKYFGTKFAVLRNVLSFLLAVVISLIIWLIY